MKKNIFKLIIAVTLVALLGVASLCFFVSAEENDSGLDISYSNLSFENEIHLLYAIESNDANVKLLVWTEPQENYTYGTQSATLSPTKRNYDIKGALYTIFEYDGLAAKNMADNVYVRAYINDGNTETYGEVDKYSILMYAYSKLGKTGVASTNENLKSMLSSMLEYGANAQKYFGYKTDRLANDNWVQIKTQGGTLEDGFNHGMYLPGDIATLIATETTDQGTFSYWEDKIGAQIATTPTYALTVDNENQLYTAQYIKYSQGLEFTSNGDGTCSVSGIGSCKDTDVRIPPISSNGDRVTSIGMNAFYNYKSIINVEIPSSVKSIGMQAFNYATNLQSVTFATNSELEYLDSYAFQQCTSLKSISFGDNSLLKELRDLVFYDCTSLNNVDFGKNSVLKIIGESAFQGCTGLINIEIPSSVTIIDKCAFLHCKGLICINIPRNAVSIEYLSFYNCIKLIEVYNESSLNIEEDEKMSYLGYYAKNIYSPDFGSTKLSKTDDGYIFYSDDSTNYLVAYSGDKTDIILPSDFYGNNYQIYKYAFCNCTNLTSIQIPTRVTDIGENAFNGCTSLKSITIPDSITSISSNLFNHCTNLQSITIPDSIKDIGSYAFFCCYSLTSITIPDSVTSIGEGAFRNCTSLTTITIPESVVSIDTTSFNGRNPELLIRCYKDSTAHIYAIENAINFELIDGDPVTANDAYVRVDSNGIEDETGEYIEIGKYPQSKVTDSTLVTELTSLAGELPIRGEAESNGWTSYSYYIQGNISHTMWYKDIEHSSEKYRAVFFTDYRPKFTTDAASSASNSYQDDNGYLVNTIYLFKFEPIRWRILTEDDNKAYLLCEMLTDCIDFYNTSSGNTRVIDGVTIYENNYEYSNVREWLNNDFYNTAFNENEKSIIQQTLVDNSVASTGYSSNKYACSDTLDYIFLASNADVTNADYGFVDNASRSKKATDYALCQGVGGNRWYLRTPDNENNNWVREPYGDGSMHSGWTNDTYVGVCPAMYIDLE